MLASTIQISNNNPTHQHTDTNPPNKQPGRHTSAPRWREPRTPTHTPGHTTRPPPHAITRAQPRMRVLMPQNPNSVSDTLTPRSLGKLRQGRRSTSEHHQ